MTTTRLDRLVLRSPDALVAALPYLLGFHPQDSAVIAWLADGRLILTQRLDLPADERVLPAWHRAVWDHPAADAADAIALVLVTDDAADDGLVAGIAGAAAERGLEVRDVVHAGRGAWRSLLCSDPGCCPPRGRPIDPGVLAEVGAEFALLGRAPMDGRADLVATMAAVPELVEEVARIAVRRRSGRALERWRDAVLDDLLALIAQGPARGPGRGLAPRTRARLLDGMADVRVRDTLLWEARAWDTADLERAVSALLPLLRSAPAGRCAPVATCVALLSWLQGDGARASMALDRAAADDPGYPLACLLAESLRQGLPPGAWTQAMAGLTRDACRRGPDQGLRSAGAPL